MNAHNGVMLQAFHWYSRDDGQLWNELAKNAKELADSGFTSVWLPPAYKGMGGAREVGYAVYDLYDLGEFDQKGSRRTKYGTRAEYLAAISALRAAGIAIYADAVLNHMVGGDKLERTTATPFAQDDRLRPRGAPRQVAVYTHFDFAGRAGAHSKFEWHAHHFDAVDYDDLGREPNTVYLLEGKRFDDSVSLENGNFSYLLGCDLDLQSDEVRKALVEWGKWYLDTTQVDGFRLDAIKHISTWFFPEWLDAMEQHSKRDLFIVGEYWSGDIDTLHRYLDAVGPRMSVFDVPLHYRFHTAGSRGRHHDMRRIHDRTRAMESPMSTVTFVDNHDSQPLQALESAVAAWFKPLAYALILLREEGYPCVFAPDYYGARYTDRGRDNSQHTVELSSHRFLIDKFLDARRKYAWGPQLDYLDHPNRVGWTRLGDDKHDKAMAVLLSDDLEGTKWMEVRRPNARFVDVTEHDRHPVVTNEHGWGEFRCGARSVSVWVET
ncbi:MAG: alpha-amylase [Polyangiaceae bacterium]|nr:alpha-amylase [Polyangiaceae bacterium]